MTPRLLVSTIGEASITLDGRKDIERIQVGSASSGATIAGYNITNRDSYAEAKEGIFDFVNAAGIGSTSIFGGDLEVKGDLKVTGDTTKIEAFTT